MIQWRIFMMTACLALQLAGAGKQDNWLRVPPGTVPARALHSAVWTGTEMLIWGGIGNTPVNQVGSYNPTTNAYSLATTPDAPSQRVFIKTLWTGSEMIIWGGTDGNAAFNDGGQYNPTTKTWTAINTTDAPSARFDYMAVWTGTEMIVWGGRQVNGQSLGNGARYNPGTNQWSPMSSTGAPSARFSAAAVWTGEEMIVWGGTDGNVTFNDGARYYPDTNEWTALESAGAPESRAFHSAVWTGTQMIVWGGVHVAGDQPTYPTLGARYNPSTDHWTALPSNGAPTGRTWHSAVWTGAKMVIWGGSDYNGLYPLGDGAGYDPATNQWSMLPSGGAPSPRSGQSAVWTGEEMIIWGGGNNSTLVFYNDGARLGEHFVVSLPGVWR